MLEQQQGQLVVGLQELYSRIVKGEAWPGDPLITDPVTGQPLTHGILERLGALKQERGGSHQFEEDFSVLQQRLYEEGAPPVLRRRSTSSSSETHARSRLNSTSSRSHTFHEAFEKHDAPPTPPPSGSLLTTSSTNDTYFGPSLNGDADNPMVIDPELMEGQPWSSAIFLDDGMDFLHRYQSPQRMDGAERPPDCQPGGASLGPEWNDDEDFKALFNQVVV